MSDLIKREDAIDELNEFIKPFVGLIGDMGAAINGAREVIKDVPSIEAIPCEVADKVGEENERLTYRIGQLEELMRWIPVSERLPKEDECVGNVWKYYLIQDEYGDMHVAHLRSRGWETIESVKALGCDVVAWMPLPNPYREENEE